MDFKITWETNGGRFGWTTVKDCAHMDDALDAFFADRIDPDCEGLPRDAEIAEITRI